MGKLAVIGVVIIIIAAAGVYIQFGVPWKPVSEADARNIIKDRYPDVDDDGIRISQQENCEVCDEFGCKILETCWVANFTSGGAAHGVVIPGSAPEGGGGIVQDEESPCTEWWCNAQPCTYYYQEIIPEGIVHHYNTECANPTPTCDQTYGACRICNYPIECLRKAVTDSENKSYYYETIGTDSWGSINESSYYCQIFSEGRQVFANETTIIDCEEKYINWIGCYNTFCKYEPRFGFIPL